MAYVLKISNTSPALYIGVSNGFFVKVDTQTSALQLARMQDAQSLQTILVDTTEPVTVA